MRRDDLTARVEPNFAMTARGVDASAEIVEVEDLGSSRTGRIDAAALDAVIEPLDTDAADDAEAAADADAHADAGRVVDLAPRTNAEAAPAVALDPTLYAADEPVASVVDLRVRLGGFEAVRGVDLALYRGAVVCLLGAPGCGASTLLRALMGLAPIVGGSAQIGDVDVADPGFDRRRLRRSLGAAYLPETAFPQRTALENATLWLDAAAGEKAPKAAREAAARDLLARLGLADRADARSAEMSPTDRRRLAIARHLASDPAAMAYDDAADAVRDADRVEIAETIRATAREGLAWLVATNDRAFAERVADVVLPMEQGALLEVAPLRPARRAA